MNNNVTLANGVTVPAIGLGTWYLGENQRTRECELESLRAGVDAGMTLIDTAEMYGGGMAEELVGEAIRTMNRQDLFLVSKVLPGNAGGNMLERALDQSMRRMGVDYLDLYLYHWRGRYPLRETVYRLEQMVKKGKIRAWGVSNFDIDDMEELMECEGGEHCLVNQVLYHVGSRGIEYSLLPWMRDHRIALMAYCPLAQGGSLRGEIFSNPVICRLAEKYHTDPAAVILAWDIRDGHTIAIPRSSRKEHTLINASADRIRLTDEDLAAIDRVFPKPVRKEFLDMQ